MKRMKLLVKRIILPLILFSGKERASEMVRTKTNRLLQHHARNAFSCLYSGYSLIVFRRVFLGSTSVVLISFSFNDNMGDRFSRISNCIISVHPILCIRSCWRDACNSDSSSRSRLYTTLFSDSTRS